MFDYVSTYEAKISVRNEDNNVRFTRFGNRAACEAIYNIYDSLDDENKKIISLIFKDKTI